jgi:5'-nucleotidase
LILSGINRGANIGTDIIYSGTAAAARQGSFAGIPSIALSLVEGDGDWYWEPAISFITEKLSQMRDYWREGTFVNVNFPNTKNGPGSLVPAFPSLRYYNDRIETYSAPAGGLYCFASLGDIESRPQPGSDWDEVSKNNAAMSVVLSQPSDAVFIGEGKT